MLNNPADTTVAASGSYSGNDSANRAIPHGLADTPSLVIITAASGFGGIFAKQVGNDLVSEFTGNTFRAAVTEMDSTNFYVGNAANYTQSANAVGGTYYWTAIK